MGILTIFVVHIFYPSDVHLSLKVRQNFTRVKINQK